MSISLKGKTKATEKDDKEANRHTLLRPRTWWENKFLKYGAVTNSEMLWAMQEKDGRYGFQRVGILVKLYSFNCDACVGYLDDSLVPDSSTKALPDRG